MATITANNIDYTITSTVGTYTNIIYWDNNNRSWIAKSVNIDPDIKLSMGSYAVCAT